MHTQSSIFKEESEKIRVEPPKSAWMRIETQLDAERFRRKFKIAHFINYAAAVVLIIVFASIGLYVANSDTWDDPDLYSLSLQALSMDSPLEASIYDIEKVKDLSGYFAGE